jgi:hypothetical protein
MMEDLDGIELYQVVMVRKYFFDEFLLLERIKKYLKPFFTRDQPFNMQSTMLYNQRDFIKDLKNEFDQEMALEKCLYFHVPVNNVPISVGVLP